MVPQAKTTAEAAIVDSLRVTRRSLIGVSLGALGVYTFATPNWNASAHPMATAVTSPSAMGDGQIREYFIAADEVDWDYAPSGMNMINGMPLDEDQQASVFTVEGPNTIGRVYKKAQYHAYTDDTFSSVVQVTSDWEHLGIMGPVIRA